MVCRLTLKFAAVSAHNWGKVMYDALRSKDTKLELVACYIEKGRVRKKNLLEDGMVEALYARPRDTNKRQ